MLVGQEPQEKPGQMSLGPHFCDDLQHAAHQLSSTQPVPGAHVPQVSSGAPVQPPSPQAESPHCGTHVVLQDQGPVPFPQQGTCPGHSCPSEQQAASGTTPQP